MSGLGRCRSCRAEIRWVQLLNADNVAGNHPIDPKPSPNKGNIYCGTDGLYRIVPANDRADRRLVWTSHFATCPSAAKHRRKR